MNKLEKEVLVVQRTKLFLGAEFTGFREIKGTEYLERIRKNFLFIKRRIAEQDPSYKQIIPYAVIANPKEKKIYFYRRGSEKGSSEKRLYSKGSIGVGGHLEREDCIGEDPIEAGMLREISEEITINGKFTAKPFGFINLESTEVSRVHFGVVYLIETDAKEVKFNNGEISEGGMLSPESIDSQNMEEWSQNILPHIKKSFHREILF